MPKLRELKKYSNPAEVERRASRLHLTVRVSSRKDKKYMLLDGTRKIHFGQMGYQDATFHRDPARIKNFKTRNHKWASYPKASAAYLSYHLLW